MTVAVGLSIAAALVCFVAATFVLIALRGRLRVPVSVALFAAAAMLLVGSAVLTRPHIGSSLGAGVLRPSAPTPTQAAAREADAAKSLLAEAERLSNRGDDRGAARLHAQALEFYRKQDDVSGQASVRLAMGRLQHYGGQSDAGRIQLTTALDLYRRAGNAAGEARALAARGDLEKDTFNWSVAAQFYRAARAAWERAPAGESDPHVVLRLPEVPQMSDAEARTVLQQADAIFAAVADIEAQGNVREFAAELNGTLGRWETARDEYTKAQSLYQQAGATQREAQAALKGARVDLHLGRNVDVALAIDAANQLFGRAGDAAGTAQAQHLRGDLERLQGRLDAARTTYVSAAEALHPMSNAAAADAMVKIGQIEMYLGRSDAARAVLLDAVALYGNGESRAGAAAARKELGVLASASGELAAAQAAFAHALNLYRELGDVVGEAQVLLHLAALNAARNERQAAQAAYVAAAERFEGAGLTFGRLLATLGRGEAEKVAGNAVASAVAYAESAALWAAMTSPVAEANRMLGLPPVSSLTLKPPDLPSAPIGRAADEPERNQDVEDIRRDLMRAYTTATTANLARFPEHNVEALALVRATANRMTSAVPLIERPN